MKDLFLINNLGQCQLNIGFIFIFILMICCFKSSTICFFFLSTHKKSISNSLMSSDPANEDGNVLFLTVPLKPLSDR